jgi:membrane-associated phospholipid phosphatase
LTIARESSIISPDPFAGSNVEQGKKMKKISVFVILIALFFQAQSLVPAQTTQTEENTEQGEPQKKEEEKPGKKRDSLLKGFAKDHGRIWTSPLRIKNTRWLVWGGVALITGILINNDEIIYRDIKDFQNRNEWVDKASPIFSGLCEGYPFPIAGIFLAGGWLFKDKKMVETGSLAIQAMLHSFVVVQAVKHLTGRERPSWNDGIDQWHWLKGFFTRYEPGQWARYDAFFSGHTVTIWSLATVIAHQYNKGPFVPVICYTLAALGGLATITEDLHWISDVFVGAVVGYAIGRFVVKRRSRRWNIFPALHRDGVGIGIGYVF